ncbi:MAG: hypothetical protein A2937_01780 [Candidatus Yonathbacteria bacterium RIFCSPLOWO2_01_FULL_47_33b]|uniref:Uncharacterized protein n=1 Tax=Candidatus Yonathbacteria bacterium RIFCSPLOWO2_01_FULL_47_33b TaxID=1802727 RepID=A0A1G2SHM0_9BACT|nr:MAG: hypothetical protein A2937_01780 [Candidatus Yonathbacteria bacterium RIFCSPLOWO2_01_FULL_47_33b]
MRIKKAACMMRLFSREKELISDVERGKCESNLLHFRAEKLIWVFWPIFNCEKRALYIAQRTDL